MATMKNWSLKCLLVCHIFLIINSNKITDLYCSFFFWLASQLNAINFSNLYLFFENFIQYILTMFILLPQLLLNLPPLPYPNKFMIFLFLFLSRSLTIKIKQKTKNNHRIQFIMADYSLTRSFVCNVWYTHCHPTEGKSNFLAQEQWNVNI